ncbi:ATP-dependent carboxylate-amine ligase [Stappia sp.]|uniref:ATP-dependent carboxylate-amine ligase n=1 Tax=Stappia sp. TaxID=1870903 RepID=UPI003A9903B3
MGDANGGAPAPRRAPVFVEILERLARQRGARVEVEPVYGYAGALIEASGRRHFFKGTHFDINRAGAAALARDKDYAARFLAAAGLAVPRGMLLHSPRRAAQLALKNPDVAARLPARQAAHAFAGEVGFPVFVKPNEGSEGEDVTRVGDAAALDLALDALFAVHERVLVQQAVTGADIRVVVLDGKVEGAFLRRPLAVTGDGVTPLSALIAAEIAGFASGGKGSRIVADDPRILGHLASAGLGPESVPASGLTVPLLANANLSTGGSARDITGELSPELADAALRACAALGLRFAGVDLLHEGEVERSAAGKTAVGRMAADKAPVVLEVNAAPGLSYFHRLGPEAAARVETIYAHLLDALLG